VAKNLNKPRVPVSVSACESRAWSFVLHDPASPEDKTVTIFRCKSWRHKGLCQRVCASCDYVRILHALTHHDHWTYCVLTFPQKKYPDAVQLFRDAKDMWSKLRKRLDYYFPGFKYIQTWESHKSGYPHANVVITHQGLFEQVCKDGFIVKDSILEPNARACGFGYVRSVGPVRKIGQFAGYLSKLSMEMADGIVKDQIPYHAPPKFRRLRASRGLLPPRLNLGTLKGKLYHIPAEFLAWVHGAEVPEDGGEV